MFKLTDTPIDLKMLTESLKESKAGAFVTFEGWVRNHNQGKAVSSLEYQVYDTLALKEGQKIIAEAKEKFNLHEVSCVHRHGHLGIGDIAVWVGASASHRNDAFLAARFVIDEIKHRLPIWKKEHYLNEKPEWVYCKDHATHVHFEEKDYYQKQKSLVNQPLLKNKKVLVIGAGGLGTPMLTALTTSGIGHIRFMDFDTIDISNLHRQPLFSISDVGEKKSVIAQNKLSELNPFVDLKAIDARLDLNNAETMIAGHDLIVDCTDNLETKFMLHDTCFKAGIPLISASIYRYEGQIRTFIPGSENGCLRCQYKTTPKDEAIGNCNDFGVLGAAVNALGYLQANEAIQFLSRGKNSSARETVYFNFETLLMTRIKNIKKEDCSLCGSPLPVKTSDSLAWDLLESLEIQAKDLGPAHQLVDIRKFKTADLDQFKDSPKKVVLLCEHGIRSRRLAIQYREMGFDHFYSLSGGEWSL